MSLSSRLASKSAMKQVLVVGGGLTSAVTCSLLAEGQPDVELTVWDKARGAGGRMSTSRSKANPDASLLDLGAQYVSKHVEFTESNKKFYEELLHAGLFQPMNIKVENMRDNVGANENYVAPNGISSVVKHFFAKSKASLNFGHHVSAIQLDDKDKKWIVNAQNGIEKAFDCVVLTLPVPQLLQLPGSVQDIMNSKQDLRNQLEAVTYSSRYALGLFYNKPIDLGLDYGARYVNDHPVIRFVSVDNVKRGKPTDPTSVVFHTSVQFGQEHVEKTPDEVKPLLVNHVKEMFPDWPEPGEVKCQKWRYSQVTSPFPNAPGCVLMNADPPLIVGGDGFVNSNFDGCLKSALTIVETLQKDSKL